MYLALGIVFLIIALLMAAGIILTFVKSSKNGGELISKKNLFYLVPTFLLLYFLHITAAAYNGENLDFFYCFSLIGNVFKVLQFEAQGSIVSPICEAYPIFYADFALAFILGVAAVILSVASFFSRRISNFISVRIALRKNYDIVVGDSENAVKYVKNNKKSLLLGTNVTGERYSGLLKEGVPVLKVSLEVKPLLKKLKRGGYNVIVFREGAYAYSKIIEIFSCLKGNKIFFEANLQEMKILKDKFIPKADKNSNLYLTGFSKYELMARRFVVDYPITKYIPRSFYNGNFTLKRDKQINVVFIGFGKVNYQLFRMFAMQFQFAKEENGKLKSAPLKYHVFDTEDKALHNEFFSRILFEFDEEFKNCDFPKPEKICDIEICHLDTNSVEARKKFKSLVDEDNFTYFIISLDKDLEDASYAQTLKRLLDGDNYRIFVRAKNDSGEKLNELDDRIIYFGEEKNLYTHANIVNDDLTELAQRINLLYNKISNPPEWLKYLQEKKVISADEQRTILNERLSDPKNKEYMIKKWEALPNIEQASNLYHALNLPFKLNLLGFDMVKKINESDNGITEAEFNEYYINSGRVSGYGDYSFYFKTESSNVLAYTEHSRWNALYILYDYKQMKKADMQVVEELDDDGNIVKRIPHKNTEQKRHACLTTYYGLNELIAFKFKTLYPGESFNIIDKNDDRLKELGKIYSYDYMDLDRLYGEISAMGYKLVKSDGIKK